MTAPLNPSRRQFLVKLAGSGLVIGSAPASLAVVPALDSAAGLAQPFLHIAPDNTVTVLAKHLDMGQGIWTGLASIIAEELDADWAQVRVEGAPADKALYKNLTFGFQTTGGSTSIANSWQQHREAGASARAMLVAAAAAQWQVPAAEISVNSGVLSHASGRRATFGELAALAAAQALPAAVTLKDPSQFKLLGKPLRRVDAQDKSRGAPLFGIDQRLPGMQIALLQRAPLFGATVRRLDASSALAVAGVREVLILGPERKAVAVLADNTWAAMQGRRALKIEWDDSLAEKRSSAQLSAEFKALAASGAGAIECLKRGDAARAMATAAQVIEAEFEAPYLAHAAMEPLAALGTFKDGRCEIWGGIQNQSGDQAAAARILGLAIEQVQLHTLYAGGSFGRRATFSNDWIAELAQVLKATAGRYPVKLMWTREDDLTAGYYRPMNVHRIKAGLDAGGKLVALQQTLVAQSFLFKPGSPPRPDPTVFEGNLPARYEVADASVDWINPAVGVPVQMYRALGYNHTTFSKEVMMDELARAAGRDALAFRLAHLGSSPAHLRQATVLRIAATMAGWGRGKLPKGQALGLAVQEAYGSFVAQVALVRLLDDGRPQVDKVWCAVDCGFALNPDIVRAQMEGGIGFGINLALHGGITLAEGGHVEQSNFHDYPVLRLTEMPRSIEVHLVPSALPPTGVGEPGSVPIAAAVANAFARLTGKAVRGLPLG